MVAIFLDSKDEEEPQQRMLKECGQEISRTLDWRAVANSQQAYQEIDLLEGVVSTRDGTAAGNTCSIGSGSIRYGSEKMPRQPEPGAPGTTERDLPSSEDEMERTRRRAYALWERDGRPEGSADRYWYQAEQDIREPVTAQALAVRTGLNIDEAQDLIDRLGADWELLEQAAASRGA